MCTNTKNQNFRFYLLLSVVCFAVFFFYSAFIEPMYIFDTDDWTYIGYRRHAVPDINQWNPTKILPETLMPFAGQVAAHIIYPFTGDFIQSLNYAFAIVFSLCVTLYFLLLVRIFKANFQFSKTKCLLLFMPLLLLHFCPISNNENTFHFFYSANITCIFNYTIPAILCTCLVLYLDEYSKFHWKQKDYYIRNGMIVLGSYVCINSNLFSSGILMSYIAIRLLTGIYFQGKSWVTKSRGVKAAFVSFISKYKYELTVSIYWSICTIMESKGSRATATGKQIDLKTSIQSFIYALKTEKIFIAVSGLIIGIAILILIFTLKQKTRLREALDDESVFGRHLIKFAACGSLSAIYVIVLSSVVDPSYILRADVMIAWNVYIIIATVYSAGYILSKCSFAVTIIPIFTYILIFETVLGSQIFSSRYYGKYALKKWDDYVVEQVISADRSGITELNLNVPQFETADGWPIAYTYGGERISYSLYSLGIISHDITIYLTPDSSMNEKFGLY